MNTIAEGLFTAEQRAYVDNVKDEDLRSHLLHQVRLRDNMESDRNAFEKQAAENHSIGSAVTVLINALSEDKSEGSYYYSWQANIAMAFQDEFNKNAADKGIEGTARNFNIHEIANNAAKNFLDLLTRVPETKTM